MTMAAGIVQELAFVLVIVVADSPLLSTVTRLFLLLLALAAGTLVALHRQGALTEVQATQRKAWGPLGTPGGPFLLQPRHRRPW